MVPVHCRTRSDSVGPKLPDGDGAGGNSAVVFENIGEIEDRVQRESAAQIAGVSLAEFAWTAAVLRSTFCRIGRSPVLSCPSEFAAAGPSGVRSWQVQSF